MIPPIRWPSPTSPAGRALAEWRTRYADSPFPYALDLPPTPYLEAHSPEIRQRFCTEIPGGCPICDAP